MKATIPPTTEARRREAELRVLRAFVGEPVGHDDLAAALRTLAVTEDEFDDEDGAEADDSAAADFAPPLEAAVASVLLASVRDRLPQYAVVPHADAEVEFGRPMLTPDERSPYAPQHLLTLNWADSGPGVCWPTAYYAVEVPELAVVVVTASADTEETMGYLDVAIGCFPAGEDLLAGVQRIVTAHWEEQRDMGQSRWAYLFAAGLVSEAVANQWADAVWGDERDEDA